MARRYNSCRKRNKTRRLGCIGNAFRKYLKAIDTNQTTGIGKFVRPVGHHLSKGRIQPNTEEIWAIGNLLSPEKQKQVLSFSGRYDKIKIPKKAIQIKETVRGKATGQSTVGIWNGERKIQFDKLERKVINFPYSVYYSADEEVIRTW